MPGAIRRVGITHVSASPHKALGSDVDLEFAKEVQPGWCQSSSCSVSSVGSSTTKQHVPQGPRPGEEVTFRPAPRGRSRAVTLAGLRVFLIERFGGLRQAFDRMDFLRDGKISCLEFQEVVSGQEHYCGLHEARQIFCILARGTDGCLRWERFHSQLVHASHADATNAETGIDPKDEVCEGGVRGSSKSAALTGPEGCSAGAALRSMLLEPEKPKGNEAEMDDVTTTAHTSTSRSSQSRPPSWRQPSPDISAPSACSAPLPVDGRAADLSGRRAVEEKAPPPSGPAESRWRGGGLDRGAFAWPCSIPGNASRDALGSLAHGNVSTSAGTGAVRADGGVCTSTKMCEGMGCGGNESVSALQRLDESLTSFRAEVRALAELRSGRAGQSCGTSCSKAPSPAQTCVPVWAQALPPQAQGRLAGCMSLEEAVEVLDEALDFLIPGSAPALGDSAISPCTERISGRLPSRQRQGDEMFALALPAPRGGNRSAVTACCALQTGPEAGPELVTASAELLKDAKARAEALEAEFKEKQRGHSEQVEKLRRQLRRERNRSVRRLVDDIAPPKSLCPSSPKKFTWAKHYAAPTSPDASPTAIAATNVLAARLDAQLGMACANASALLVASQPKPRAASIPGRTREVASCAKRYGQRGTKGTLDWSGNNSVVAASP